MKTLICHCDQCLARRKKSKKKNRVQTYQVRAAKSRVREQLRILSFEDIEDLLDEKVKVDYYA